MKPQRQHKQATIDKYNYVIRLRERNPDLTLKVLCSRAGITPLYFRQLQRQFKKQQKEQK